MSFLRRGNGHMGEGSCNLLNAQKMSLSCSNYFLLSSLMRKRHRGLFAHGKFQQPPTHTIHSHFSCATAHYIKQQIIHTRTIRQDSSKMFFKKELEGTHGGEISKQIFLAQICLQKFKGNIFSLAFYFFKNPIYGT